MAMGMPYGLQAMLKEGHKHLSGLEEAVLKNIEACKGLAEITRTSMGPNGNTHHHSASPPVSFSHTEEHPTQPRSPPSSSFLHLSPLLKV